jgi:acetyltransferase
MELASVASVLLNPLPEGRKLAIVTHAGGPAVMMTDELARGGIDVPVIKGESADRLLEKLLPGSSVSNPIDLLATCTAELLGYALDACENDFDSIDAVAVIFGSPGLFPLDDIYDLLDAKMKTMKKPVYPVLPSMITAGREVGEFIAKGRINFPDEVVFASALSKVMNRPDFKPSVIRKGSDKDKIRELVDKSANGYLSPELTSELLDAAGIERVGEAVVSKVDDALNVFNSFNSPVAMKVVGPVHKSDVGGVVLGVDSDERVREEFDRLMSIKDTEAVLMQQMAGGTELFIGAKREEGFGHLVMAGLGGIFVEVLKDISSALTPVSEMEADNMIKSLRGYKLLEGVRGMKGIDIEGYRATILKVSAMLEAAPEIFEMDLNPLLGSEKGILAVDARIRIEKDNA